MTEGFDFPRLKVAAYHRPHRTLGPTLQFIGRLARQGDVSGELVAYAEDVSEETALLYREEAVWEELLPAMVDSSVDDEQRVRRFAKGLATYDPAIHRVPALSIAPSRMTHVYRLTDEPTLDWSPETIAGGEVIERYQHVRAPASRLHHRHRLHPRFLRRDMLDSHEHFLHIATWVGEPGVLFISTELDSALKDMRLAIAGGRASPVDAVDPRQAPAGGGSRAMLLSRDASKHSRRRDKRELPDVGRAERSADHHAGRRAARRPRARHGETSRDGSWQRHVRLLLGQGQALGAQADGEPGRVPRVVRRPRHRPRRRRSCRSPRFSPRTPSVAGPPRRVPRSP